MNLLEIIGVLSILLISCIFIYALVISPIIEIIEAYRYNKRLSRLEQVKMDIEYWYDKLYMLTNETMTIERQMKDKQVLIRIYDEYKKNNDIIREEISNKIGWILDSEEPSELSDRYYKAHRDIKNLKDKLGIKY
jgi:biopolymer transport protein ExbB/TolQ